MTHGAVFTRADTLSQIALARSVVEAAQSTQSDPAKRCFGPIAMQANLRAR